MFIRKISADPLVSTSSTRFYNWFHSIVLRTPSLQDNFLTATSISCFKTFHVWGDAEKKLQTLSRTQKKLHCQDLLQKSEYYTNHGNCLHKIKIRFYYLTHEDWLVLLNKFLIQYVHNYNFGFCKATSLIHHDLKR